MDDGRTSPVARLQDQLRDGFFGKPQVARIKTSSPSASLTSGIAGFS
jgi:hypothetical protein